MRTAEPVRTAWYRLCLNKQNTYGPMGIDVDPAVYTKILGCAHFRVDRFFPGQLG